MVGTEPSATSADQGRSSQFAKGENITPQKIEEQQKAVESAYTDLMDRMESDATDTGRYFATFGQKNAEVDERILLLTHSTAAVGTEPLFIALTKDGPITFKLSNGQTEKLKSLRAAIISEFNQSGFSIQAKGGNIKSFNARKLFFGDPQNVSETVVAPSVLVADQKTFLDSVKLSREKAENPSKKKYAREVARLDEANQISAAFGELISQPASQGPSNGQPPTA